MEECACSDGSVPVHFELCDTRTGCEDVSLQLKKKKILHHTIFTRDRML